MTNFVVEVDGISCDYCGLKPSEYKDGCVLRYPDGSGGCGYIRDEIERLRAERDDAVKRMQDGWIEVCQATFPPLFEKLRAERDEAVRRLAEAERLLIAHRFCGDQYPIGGWPEINEYFGLQEDAKRREADFADWEAADRETDDELEDSHE